MDFSKLKEGAVSLSAFLAGHSFWAFLTLYSVWSAFHPFIEPKVQEAYVALIGVLNQEDAKLLLETYGLKPLIPALTLFFVIFLLYAHREILEWIGFYTPPELCLHWMPGMRDIDPGRWHYIMGEIGKSCSFTKLRELVEWKYGELDKSGWDFNHFLIFKLFKGIAVINIALIISTLGNVSRENVFILFGAIVAAAIVAFAQIYHHRNQSLWAIENILKQIVSDNISGKINLDFDPGRSTEKNEIEQARNFHQFEKASPVCTLSWQLPIVGNIHALKERLVSKRG